jgi:hypothetical protein
MRLTAHPVNIIESTRNSAHPSSFAAVKRGILSGRAGRYIFKFDICWWGKDDVLMKIYE